MFVLLLACTGSGELAAVPPPEPIPAARAAAPAVVAAEVVVRNDTEATVTLDRSFGPAAMIHIAAQGGTPLPAGTQLDDVDDAQTGGWIATCVCDCETDEECPECEPPQDVKVVLAPGESYTAPWSGRLRAWLPGTGCVTRYPTAPGAYILTACSEEGACGRAERTLPSDEPITLSMSQVATAATCADLSPEAMRRAGAATLSQVSRILPDRPVDACPRSLSCIEPDAAEAFFAEAHSQPCAAAIIPRGSRVEAVVFLPLPEGTHGGERYTHSYDPDATHLFDARYEQ